MQKVTGVYLCLPVAGSRPPFFHRYFFAPSLLYGQVAEYVYPLGGQRHLPRDINWYMPVIEVGSMLKSVPFMVILSNPRPGPQVHRSSHHKQHNRSYGGPKVHFLFSVQRREQMVQRREQMVQRREQMVQRREQMVQRREQMVQRREQMVQRRESVLWGHRKKHHYSLPQLDQ